MAQLVLTSDTLAGTPATGTLEYNGQFFGTDSAAARAQMQRITQGTAVASTSGTSIDFTSIPAWVKRITVMLSGVSTNGTSNPQVQLGAGSLTTSGYTGYNARQAAASNAYVANSAGFILGGSVTAAISLTGRLVITLISGNTWICSGITTNAIATGDSCTIAGAIALGGALDRVRITTVNGTDTFDAGSVNILYEG